MTIIKLLLSLIIYSIATHQNTVIMILSLLNLLKNIYKGTCSAYMFSVRVSVSVRAMNSVMKG